MLRRMPVPPCVPLGDREVAFSFMSRLAWRNGVGLSDFAVDMGLPVLSIVQGKVDALKGLAELGGIPGEAVCGWTPSPVDRGS